MAVAGNHIVPLIWGKDEGDVLAQFHSSEYKATTKNKTNETICWGWTGQGRALSTARSQSEYLSLYIYAHNSSENKEP